MRNDDIARLATAALQRGATGDMAQICAARRIPELWQGGTCLYVGASVNRAQLLEPLWQAGHEVTLLEIWPANCDHYRGNPKVAHVVEGDVRTVDALELPHEQYDVVVWWHGPEHVELGELEQTIRALEARARHLVVLASPWGRWEQGEYGGNPHEEHVTEMQVTDYASLGYTVAPFGEQDNEDTGRLLAWKLTGLPRMMPRVAVGFPIITGQPTWGLFSSMMNLERPPDDVAITREWGLPVDEARNELCRWFLEETDSDYLWQVDHDAVLHPGTLTRLLSWNVPIVSALSWIRHRPVMPSITQQRPDGTFGWNVGAVAPWIREHEIWAHSEHGPVLLEPAPLDSLYPLFDPPGYSGMHCVLMRRDALEQMGAPWFKRTDKCVGEDRYFFSRAVVEGIPAYVDRSVLTGHIWGEVSIGVGDFLAYAALKGAQQ